MAEIYVTSTADSGAGSLRQAIADAQDGDVILFDSDVFPVGQTTSILLSSHLTSKKFITINGDGRVTLDGQSAVRIISAISGDITINNVIFAHGSSSYGGGIGVSSTTNLTLNGCTFDSCSATNSGGAVYTSESSQNAFNNCVFNACTSESYGGVLRANNASKNVLNNCIIADCTSSSGGAFYVGDTSQNTLNGCAITGCSATNGVGVYSAGTSQNTLNDCNITGCSATQYGSAVYAISTSQNTLTDCAITGCLSGFSAAYFCGMTSVNTLNNCTMTGCSATANSGVGGIYIANTSSIDLDNCTVKNNTAPQTQRGNAMFDGAATIYGITTIGAATINAVTITIADGAALTITDSATIGAATFTSEGRGYLATAAGIDTSRATLTNVVLCAYGADVSSFVEVDGVLEWEAANPTTTVLIERADGDSWSTVSQPTGESLTLYLPPSDTVRLFDGVRFFTAQAPAQRTYYYIGGSEGSFTSAADWSLRRGGVAITEPPVVAGQRFIVGDIEDAQEE